jgi:histidinol-phosphatase (PHP family)
LLDYHVHERHSRDALAATVAEYVKMAEIKGINEIAFTTHLITSGPDIDVSIPESELSEYIKEIEKASETTRVKLKTGLEVDYFSEEQRNLDRIINEYNFDFILGSTHYINGVDIGARTLAQKFFTGRSISEGADEYFRVWIQAIESGLFDVMAHPDYWRKYVHLFRQTPKWGDFGSVVYDALESLSKNKVGIEVNTSGIRHGTGSFFPLQEFLLAAKEAGVNIVTVGSDSHTTNTLGFKVTEALKQLRYAGFDKVCTFSGRKINHQIEITEV